jgi:hypothetical protein
MHPCRSFSEYVRYNEFAVRQLLWGKAWSPICPFATFQLIRTGQIVFTLQFKPFFSTQTCKEAWRSISKTPATPAGRHRLYHRCVLTQETSGTFQWQSHSYRQLLSCEYASQCYLSITTGVTLQGSSDNMLSLRCAAFFMSQSRFYRHCLDNLRDYSMAALVQGSQLPAVVRGLLYHDCSSQHLLATINN